VADRKRYANRNPLINRSALPDLNLLSDSGPFRGTALESSCVSECKDRLSSNLKPEPLFLRTRMSM
jgi:hypothetical protein